MTLLDKLRAITKSTTTETSDINAVGFLNSGANFAVSSIPNFLLWFLAEAGADVTNDSGFVVTNINEISSVTRGDYECDEVDSKMSWQLDNANSMHKATTYYPKYYIRGNKVFVKPAPTVSIVANIYKVTIPTITSSTDDESISYNNIENIIVNYAAMLDYESLSGYYSAQAMTDLAAINSAANTAFLAFASALPTDWTDITIDDFVLTNIQDALTKAQELIDGTVTDLNAQEFIDDDDSEMTSATIQTAAEEVNRASQEIAKEKLKPEHNNAEMQEQLAGKQSDLARAKAYLEEASIKLQQIPLVQTYMAKAQQYESLSKQTLEMINMELSSYINSSEQILKLQATSKQPQGN